MLKESKTSISNVCADQWNGKSPALPSVKSLSLSLTHIRVSIPPQRQRSKRREKDSSADKRALNACLKDKTRNNLNPKNVACPCLGRSGRALVLVLVRALPRHPIKEQGERTDKIPIKQTIPASTKTEKHGKLQNMTKKQKRSKFTLSTAVTAAAAAIAAAKFYNTNTLPHVKVKKDAWRGVLLSPLHPSRDLVRQAAQI